MDYRIYTIAIEQMTRKFLICGWIFFEVEEYCQVDLLVVYYE